MKHLHTPHRMRATVMATLIAVAGTGCVPKLATRDPTTGCATATPRPLTVVAIDTSDAFTERQQALLRLLLDRSWRQVPNEGEFRVYTLNGSVAEAIPALALCREARPGLLDGPKTKQYQAYLERAKRRDEAVAAEAEAITQTSGVPRSTKGSRIYEWLSALRGDLPDRTYTARQLLVASDFRQFSPQFTNANLPAGGIDLRGFRLNVVVLGDGRTLPERWNKLLQAAGAAPTSVEVERVPGELLQ